MQDHTGGGLGAEPGQRGAVEHDVPLSDLTTLQVGGPARTLVRPDTRDELIETLRDLWDEGEDWLVVGGGSNLLISDEGFDGTVVQTRSRGVTRLPAPTLTSSVPLIARGGSGALEAPPRPRASSRRIRVQVQAGESWDELVAQTVDNGWSGIEALSGIPGFCGAAPVQNIGAYGQELAATLVAVEFIDAATGDVRRWRASEIGLGYRTSIFKRGRSGVVTSIELELLEAEPGRTALSGPIAYAQLASALGVRLGDHVPIAALRETVLELRRSKGMVLDPAEPDSVSAGSFFTNPIVGEHFARTLPAAAPRWPTSLDEPDIVVPLDAGSPAQPLRSREYRVKLSAAWLIERAGIVRGFSLPGSGAAISSKHTLAIINRGSGSAADVAQLAGYVQTRVESEFGVRLQPEPVLVGLEL